MPSSSSPSVVTDQDTIGNAGILSQMSDIDPWDLLDFGSNNTFGGILGGLAEVAGGAGGAAAGAALGPIAVMGGARTIAKELDKDGPSNGSHLIDGGLSVAGGLAGTIGGVGSLAGSSTLASLGPVGAVIGAGAAGFTLGTAIGENVIDPYLNRPHTEEITPESEKESQEAFEAWQNGETTITQDINNWLDSW